MIKIFPCSSACAYACVYAALSENETPLRHITRTRIFTTSSYVWLTKTLDPNYLAPKQFEEFGWFCLCCVEFRFHLGPIACACDCVSSENQASGLLARRQNPPIFLWADFSPGLQTFRFAFLICTVNHKYFSKLSNQILQFGLICVWEIPFLLHLFKQNAFKVQFATSEYHRLI